MKRSLVLLLSCILVLISTGCVRRVVTINSQPQGADIYLDRKLIGQTPYQHEFLHYGGHHLELIKENHANLRTTLELKGPFYERFPLVIFSELLIPWEILDTHLVSYKLRKGESKAPIITPVEKPQPELSAPRLERINTIEPIRGIDEN